MKIFLNKSEVINIMSGKKSLGFVPTMGALHKGHVSLIKRSIKECSKTLVTIFINEPQFNKKNDYNSYPRVLKKDILLLKRLKVQYLYLPKNFEIYPNGSNKNIKINNFSKKLCGINRKGHFEAVVDVIERFIHIIKPTKIFLGEKDMQQLKIIQDYLKKINSDVKVIGCRTIREKNGLALSSRNYLLSKNEKLIGSKVFKILKDSKKKLIKNKKYIIIVKKNIYKIGVNKIEYINLIDVNKIIKPYVKTKKIHVFISYYIKKVRLIDNI